MTHTYVVVCQYDEPFDTYGLFLHEADLLLLELANAINAGSVTVEEAKEMWEPYRDLFPELYQPGFEERYGEPFPTMTSGMDTLPATHQFEEAVQNLDIARAGYVSPSASTGTFVTVVGREALEEVRRRLYDRYRIVVLDGSEPEDFRRGGPRGRQRAIAWVREREGLAV